MKITGVRVQSYRIPLVEPFRIALGTTSVAEIIGVEVTTDEGLLGYGEAAPAKRITGDNVEGVKYAIGLLGEAIKGMDPMDMEQIYWSMEKVMAHCSEAKTALDIALHDLMGKILNQPLYKLLGGYRTEFFTDISLGIDEPQIMAKKAKNAVDEGFHTIKIKIGTGFVEDINRVKAIREAVGKNVTLRLDANQAYKPKEALKIIDKLADHDIELMEQPVPWWDFDGLAYVTMHSPIPIMADESIFNAKDALRIVEEHAADLINIKLMKCGGIKEAMKITTVAEAAGVECMLGCMTGETNIAITAAASFGAAVKNITRADLDSTFTLTSLPMKGGVSFEGGRILLPQEPGLGLLPE